MLFSETKKVVTEVIEKNKPLPSASQPSKETPMPTILVSDEVEQNPNLEDIPEWDNPYEEKKEKTHIKIENVENMSAHKIWGIVLVRLREEGYMMLHTAGGDITDLKMQDGKIVAKVKQHNLYTIMTQEDNFNKISLELKQINDKLEIEFVFDPPKESPGKKNLPLVKNLFGEFLKTNE